MNEELNTFLKRRKFKGTGYKIGNNAFFYKYVSSNCLFCDAGFGIDPSIQMSKTYGDHEYDSRTIRCWNCLKQLIVKFENNEYWLYEHNE